jgi:hypothetical protein
VHKLKFGVLLLASCAIHFGQVIDIHSVSGIWSSANPGAGVSGVGSGEIAWGDPASSAGKSKYVFTNLVPPEIEDVPAGQYFKLGVFTHKNNPIYDPLLTSAVLDVTINMAVPANGPGGASNVTKTFQYNFAHDETNNGGSRGQCPYGGANNQGINYNGCADRVLIANPLSIQSFTVGNILYTLKVGFSTDGGKTVTDTFLTKEKKDNYAKLYGKFETTVVPEPSFYAFLSLGVAGVCVRARRRKNR